MQDMLFAELAVFAHLKPIFQGLFVLVREIIDSLAFCAFQFDHVVLGHTDKTNRKQTAFRVCFYSLLTINYL